MVSLKLNKLLLAISIGSILGALFFYYLDNWWEGYRIRQRRKHGVRAEARATKILKKYGYKMCGIILGGVLIQAIQI